MVAIGPIGVAFDIAEPLSSPVEYCELVPADRGQARYRLPRTALFVSANGSMSGHISTGSCCMVGLSLRQVAVLSSALLILFLVCVGQYGTFA